ncbi:unannotated protein [freshwater metagenome]|uniref:Unannotated protein n=2 Tax=freshwater metagenome TaxID=449393 RepID=A0A6J7D9R5_9ZZZZ
MRLLDDYEHVAGADVNMVSFGLMGIVITRRLIADDEYVADADFNIVSFGLMGIVITR